MGKRDRPLPPPPAAGPFNDAFSKLRSVVPDAGSPGVSAVPDTGAASAPDARLRAAKSAKPAPARAVVRLERKGRGGKEATVVEKLALPPGVLAEWADAAKRALGCGGGVEGDAIVLQGDQRDRARAWLEARGVKRVVAG